MMSLKHMMKPFSDFHRDIAGLAAMEFAIIAPVMIVLFFAVIEGSDALSASRRASLAVNTLADLVAQETSVTNAALADLFDGVEHIIDQRGANATFTLVSVINDDNGTNNPRDDKIVVDWSRDSNGTTPYAKGSEYTSLSNPDLLDDASSLIVGELTYKYKSKVSKYLIDEIDMKKQATRWPRRSFKVEHCATAC